MSKGREGNVGRIGFPEWLCWSGFPPLARITSLECLPIGYIIKWLNKNTIWIVACLADRYTLSPAWGAYLVETESPPSWVRSKYIQREHIDMEEEIERDERWETEKDRGMSDMEETWEAWGRDGGRKAMQPAKGKGRGPSKIPHSQPAWIMKCPPPLPSLPSSRGFCLSPCPCLPSTLPSFFFLVPREREWRCFGANFPAVRAVQACHAPVLFLLLLDDAHPWSFPCLFLPVSACFAAMFPLSLLPSLSSPAFHVMPVSAVMRCLGWELKEC